jgi:hypothetical protein
MIEPLTPPSLALAAASQATEATAEILRFVHEGQAAQAAFADDAIEKLADALKLVLEVEQEIGVTDEGRGQLHAALCRYLDGWAG